MHSEAVRAIVASVRRRIREGDSTREPPQSIEVLEDCIDTLAPPVSPSPAGESERERTHWDECWRTHHICAVAKIEAISADSERLRWFEDMRHSLGVTMRDNTGGRCWVAHVEQEDGSHKSFFGSTPQEAIDAARTPSPSAEQG